MHNTDYSSMNLAGKFLIATPHSSMTDVFNKSLVYVATHSSAGAVGLVVNHLVNTDAHMQNILKFLKDDKDIHDLRLPVYLGGPVETERGFILHTAEYDQNLLLKFPDNLAVSSNVNILKDIKKGAGPKSSLFVLGYTGWNAGQLEDEVNSNLWLVSEADKDLIFDDNNDEKWSTALSKIGVSESQYYNKTAYC